MENNRKVTHGCIIATLKLFLPDGKEAKASPSITEGNRQGKKSEILQFFFLNKLVKKLFNCNKNKQFFLFDEMYFFQFKNVNFDFIFKKVDMI